MDAPRARSSKPPPVTDLSLTPQEQAVVNAIRETPYGSVEVVLHQSRIVQIVRTEKVKVEDTSLPG